MKTLCRTNSLQFVLLGILLLTSAAHAAVTPVHLITENAALSAWEDGANIDARLQIKNDGVAQARNVRVDSVTLRGGIVQTLDPLPQALGDIEPEVGAVLNLRLTVPRLDGTHYLLTINGRYTYAGQDYDFSLNRYLDPGRAPAKPLSAHDGISAIQHPDTARYPLPPSSFAEEPNAETRNFIPPDPLHHGFAPPATPSLITDPNSADAHTQVNVTARQLQYLFSLDGGINGIGNRPRAYIRIDTLTLTPRPSKEPSGLDIYFPLAEYDIWHPDHAHAMALATFPNVGFPSIGIAFAGGGEPTDYPKFPVGFKDEFVAQISGSNAAHFDNDTQARNISGTRPLAAEVHGVLQKVSGSNCATTGCRTVIRYVQFGRPSVVIGLR